jgi:hypothetical protein
MRWHADDLEAIDRWRHQQPDSPARPETIRRLVRLALTEGGRNLLED